MKWLRDSIEESVPTISLHVKGRVSDIFMTLVVETGETLYAAFLATVMPYHAGFVTANIGDVDNTSWLTLGTGLDSECWLGTLTEGSYPITFRLNFPEDQGDGIVIIPIMLGHGRGVPKKCLTFRADYDKVWIDNYAAASPWAGYKNDRDSGGRPYRIERHEAGPEVQQFHAVYVDTDDSRRIHSAQIGAGDKQSCVVGIVTDAGIIPTFREFSAAICDPISGRIYEHGGQIEGSAVKSTAVFDTDNRCWLANAADSAAERYYHAIAYYDGKIYIHGGKGASGEVLNSLEALDITTGLWTTLTAGGTARYGHFMFAFDDLLYCVGGLDADDEADISVDMYDPDLDEWSVPDPIFTLSLGFAGPGEGEAYPYLPALAFDPDTGYLYTYGGWDITEEKPGNSVNVYDLSNGEQVFSTIFSASDDRWTCRGLIATIGTRKAFVFCGGRCNSSFDEDGETVNDDKILIFWLDTGTMTYTGITHERRVMANTVEISGTLFYWGGKDTDLQENMEIVNLQTKERELLIFTDTKRRVVKAGTVTNRAWDWNPGDQIWLEPNE